MLLRKTRYGAASDVTMRNKKHSGPATQPPRAYQHREKQHLAGIFRELACILHLCIYRYYHIKIFL